MPRDIWTMLKTRTRLAGYPGLMACAVGGIDMALWDALAKAHGLPLASLLGAEPRPVWVYDSLGQMGPEETARDIERSLKDGFRAFKVKSGDPDPRVDVAVARAIKSVAGDDAWTAMDFNQAFTAEEAVKRMHLLDHEGIAWIEEPVAWDDFEGHANVRAAISTPVQSGENWYGARDMAKMLEAGAIDHAMPDAMRIGGVTGWMEVAGLAQYPGLEPSLPGSFGAPAGGDADLSHPRMVRPRSGDPGGAAEDRRRHGQPARPARCRDRLGRQSDRGIRGLAANLA